ncbi:MAG: AAA family ATPase [Desulfocapsaceae bacterium]
MYLSFYNLLEKPFSINTDPKFLWLGEKHKEALANLKFGLIEANGYVVLTGDVGTGKTTIVNALIQTLDKHVRVAIINHPTLNILEFFNLIAKAYDLAAEITSKAEFLSLFSSFLQTSKEEGQVVLLVIDEAHRLSAELLEEIRLLSNIEQTGTSLIKIFFVGQNELKQVLFAPECRALRQRITLFYEIEPLLEDELPSYIGHRLRIAGGETNMFTPGALHKIQDFTKGYPRLINTLCNHALLTGCLKEQKTIDEEIIVECAKDIICLDPQTSSFIFDAAQNPNKRGKHLIRKLQTKTDHTEDQQSQGSKISYKRWLAGATGLVALIAVAVGFTNNLRSPDIDNESASLNNTESTNAPNVPVDPAVQTNGQLPSREIEPAQKTLITSDQAEVPEGGGSYSTGITSAELPPQVERPLLATQSSELPAAPEKEKYQTTLAASAAAALKKNDFQLALDILETERILDNESFLASRELYLKALVGRAEQILVTSPDESEALLLQAIEIDPYHIAAHLNLGKLYTKAQKYKAAIDAYQHVVRLDQKLSQAFFNLGFINATIGNYSDAEENFTRVVELKPSYLDKALFNLALVQEKLGKKEACLENLRLAMTISPDNKKMQTYFEQLAEVPEEKQ